MRKTEGGRSCCKPHPLNEEEEEEGGDGGKIRIKGGARARAWTQFALLTTNMKTFVSIKSRLLWLGSTTTDSSFIFFFQLALFALVAAVSAESEAFYGLAGYPYGGYGGYGAYGAYPYAHAPAPAHVPQVEQPSGFYYHVQTYDKTPALPAPQLSAVPAVPNADLTAAAAPYSGYNWAPYAGYNAWNWAGHYNGLYNPYYYNNMVRERRGLISDWRDSYFFLSLFVSRPPGTPTTTTPGSPSGCP